MDHNYVNVRYAMVEILFSIAVAVFFVTVLFISILCKDEAHEKISAVRSNCWEYAIETSSDFLASVLTNPKVEPLIVNAISKAIDLWVSQNSNDAKSTMQAVPEKAKGNMKVALDLLDDKFGTSKEVRSKIGDSFDKIGTVFGKNPDKKDQ